MDEMQTAAVRKRSFELHYNGGTIWCEHLDGMGGLEKEVLAKFTGDIAAFSRPSVSSCMIVDLDDTVITERIATCIVAALSGGGKFRKVAFVGVKPRWHRAFRELESCGIMLCFIDDYEKAKKWVLP